MGENVFYTMFIHQSRITCFITAALLSQVRLDSSSDIPALTQVLNEAIVGLCVSCRGGCVIRHTPPIGPPPARPAVAQGTIVDTERSDGRPFGPSAYTYLLGDCMAERRSPNVVRTERAIREVRTARTRLARPGGGHRRACGSGDGACSRDARR
jgi:hypothetical protein